MEELSPGGLALTRRGLELCGLLGATAATHTPPGPLVADMGCGYGHSVRLLQQHGYNALGLDIVQRKPPAQTGSSVLPPFPFILASAEHPPLAPASLDAVLCQCVLSLLPAPARCLRTFAELCRPGGWLLLSDLYVRTPAPADYVFSLHGMAAALAAAGWTLHHAEDHSRALALFAAQRAWRGHDGETHPNGDCGHSDGLPCLPPLTHRAVSARECGYALWTARKETS